MDIKNIQIEKDSYLIEMTDLNNSEGFKTKAALNYEIGVLRKKGDESLIGTVNNIAYMHKNIGTDVEYEGLGKYRIIHKTAVLSFHPQTL